MKTLRSFRPPRGPETGGFTLLELIVVLLISVAALATIAPSVIHPVNAGSAAQFATELTQLLQRVRARAIVEQTPYLVVFERDLRTVNAEPITTQLVPEGITLRVTGVGDAERPTIVFMSDGSSSGGEYRIRGPRGSRIVNVDWLSGRTHLVSGRNDEST